MEHNSLTVLMEQRDRWLSEQIRQLSVTLLSQGIFTCTECGEVAGEYILQQGEDSLRLSSLETYALLQYLTQQAHKWIYRDSPV